MSTLVYLQVILFGEDGVWEASKRSLSWFLKDEKEFTVEK
jgi:hypothetical protein